MDNDTAVTGQKPVLADPHNEPELVTEAEERHVLGTHHSKVDATGEAKVVLEQSDEKVDDDDTSDSDAIPDDLFVSFPLLKGVPLEESPLTVRAVLIGIVLGSLCNASNVYLGMKQPVTRTLQPTTPPVC